MADAGNERRRIAFATASDVGDTVGFTIEDVAEKALRSAAVLWFLVAVAGQWLFVVYIVGFFGPPTLTGEFEAWNRNKLLSHGYLAGDTVGNLAFAAHVIMAAVITFGGTLQLIPQIRARAISFHRWNGRLFILTAFAISLAGLYLTWTRGSFSIFSHPPITLNAVLILFCAAQAYGYALARDIDTHRRWALRAFVLVNGVWFIRIGFSAWIVMTQGVVASPKFDPVFFIFWSYGCYLLPLAVLELYLRTEGRTGVLAKFAVTTLVIGFTGLTAIGIFGAYMIFWRPLL